MDEREDFKSLFFIFLLFCKFIRIFQIFPATGMENMNLSVKLRIKNFYIFMKKKISCVAKIYVIFKRHIDQH